MENENCANNGRHREQTAMTVNATLPLWFLEFSGYNFQSLYLRNGLTVLAILLKIALFMSNDGP